MLHHLLEQQLELLAARPDQAPEGATWTELLKKISETYAHLDGTIEKWTDAYSALHEELTGSYEDLRRYSADLLRNERDKLQAIIESLGEGLCSLNESGCLLFLNPTGSTLLGWDESEVRGQLILDWLLPSAAKETTTESLLRQIRLGETYAVVDGQFLHQDGSLIPVSYVLNPIMRDGIFQGAVLTFRDITELKEIQIALERRLQETLLLLNRVISATTSTLDLAEVLNTVCKELARFLGLPQAAFGYLDDDKTHLKIIAEYRHEDRLSALGEVIPVSNNQATQEVLRTRKPLYIQDAQTDPRQAIIQNLSRRRGTRSLLIVPLVVRDQVLGTLGLNASEIRHFTEPEIQLVQNVARAVSQALENAQLYTAISQELAERKAAEIALAQARDKAIEANRLQSEFVAKVSHELRTPLTAIMGFSEMVQLGIYGIVTDEQVEILEKIMVSTDGLVTLVNDLLDIAQLEAGYLHIDEVPFEPQSLLNRIESTMRVLAEKRGLELDIILDKNLPPLLIGDEDRLYQILINLVNNAIKFSPSGKVSVELSGADDAHWHMIVSDTGIGIAPEKHKVIFDRFQQVRFAPTHDHRGIGLGLAIVKQLTDTMNGSIKLESEVGQGSRFIIQLPLELPEAAVKTVSM